MSDDIPKSQARLGTPGWVSRDAYDLITGAATKWFDELEQCNADNDTNTARIAELEAENKALREQVEQYRGAVDDWYNYGYDREEAGELLLLTPPQETGQ